MKYAIISDIHSNLEALEAVFNEIEKRKVGKIICLGDIVGYGASPNEVIEILVKKNTISILGNHDYAVFCNDYFNFFRGPAREAILYTQKVISQENKEFLTSLPLRIEIGNFEGVHSSFYKPYSWLYIFDNVVELNFLYLNKKIGFFGHTHIPVLYSFDLENKNVTNELIREQKFYTLDLNRKKYLINPGSVGQPRDKINKASFVILDDDKQIVEFVRVDYDIDKSAKKIMEAGLDPFLANRLYVGE